jgi:ferrochelatase
MTTGVLLVQLGTPDAPTTSAVRRYLREFLSDRRVVDVSPWVWKPILHGIVLRVRPRRSAALYRRIWTDEGSPLLVHTRALAESLARRLGDEARVRFGMRYGRPALADALDRFRDEACERVVAVPLFPQYSTATTASVQDAIDRWARRRRPGFRTAVVRSFPDHPAYVEALRAGVVEAGFEATRSSPLVMSFHGIPQRYADRGDPYPQECERTAGALAAALDLEEGAWRLTYQSRFGREPWLQPYADEVLRRLPVEGIRSVGVVTPSFFADCLETIDEIGREAREAYEAAGGERFVRVPCLNASKPAVDAIEAIVRERL